MSCSTRRAPWSSGPTTSVEGRAQSLHELSRFVRDDAGRWVYLGAVEAEVD